VIIGTARDRKTKAPLALLARADAQGLAYAGPAFIALSSSERAELSVRLQTSKLERCPIPKLRFPDAQWAEPQLQGPRSSSLGERLSPTRHREGICVATRCEGRPLPPSCL